MGQAWEITGQRETTKANAAGQYINVMAVTFTTAKGHTGTVTVPLPLYTAEYVKELVQGRVDQIEAVDAL
jgi:hypothetical protein